MTECRGCEGARVTKRAAIVAVPLTKTNPKWLKRFQDKASDLLLQRSWMDESGLDGSGDIGEFWGRSEKWLDDGEIIEEACKQADWMRFKRSKLVMGEPTAVCNAFAGMVHQSSRYEDVPGAVKVEREIPDRDGEVKVAYIRAQMPEMCALHTELAALQSENAALKREQLAQDTKTYVKLSTRLAKMQGQELSGRVRVVSFAPSGTIPLQGETVRPMLKPLDRQKRQKHHGELSLIEEFMKSHPQSRS